MFDSRNNINNNINNNKNGGFIQISDASKNQNQNQNGVRTIPDTDVSARSRCFDYLVGAIDEAWARYCDATTSVEDEAYGYITPNSIATDEEDYLDNSTDFTDYDDSDYEISNQHKQQHKQNHQQQQQQHRPSIKPSLSNASTCTNSKQDPASCQLQALKDRLTRAKYYLQDLVDSEDCAEVNSFWKRWDMIKYATIELVEDDDDDEIVETTIDELENGRLCVN